MLVKFPFNSAADRLLVVPKGMNEVKGCQAKLDNKDSSRKVIMLDFLSVLLEISPYRLALNLRRNSASSPYENAA